MSGSKSLEELSHPSYWDNRYAGKFDPETEEVIRDEGEEDVAAKKEIESFEWFKDFQSLKPFFEKHLPSPGEDKEERKGPRVLHLGCGNSTLTYDLHIDGYRNQISVDFSEVVIQRMSKKYSDLNTTWTVMDVRNMKLEDGEIDVAIDKGTLDAMIHGSMWDPPQDVRENVGRYVDEVARVLKPGGQWLYITYRQPHFMKPFLLREGIWETEMEVLGGESGAFEYFGWRMKKL
ncbi:e348e4a1-4fd9-45a3-b1eb-fc42f559b4e1 [Sclerotinia trifoliorum]|uniref:E348e4a1-4fd9-45a3-b1eb-fc42f559b4e1 n=1 Tax=Sclerotinia trifoliorum TaxID=28548 RepID=A0A8H2VMN4_9HELO|nr:e348e4a1-4fd9-45a3-b1eb-fc42f559b4e1 [Sclerotinia trifoliorum]